MENVSLDGGLKRVSKPVTLFVVDLKKGKKKYGKKKEKL